MNKSGQGFLTFAKNSSTTDYLELAYAQAMNIKNTQTINRYAVVVDQKTSDLITDKHKRCFDHVITADISGPFSSECQAFWLTPFKETIKVEADLLFTRSIDHWWTAFRLRDLVLSHGCRDYQQNISHNRKYRRSIDDNHLPDVYNGLMYFRFSQTAKEFFTIASQIQKHWSQIRDHLKNIREDSPSTDVLFALASQIVGREMTTIPTMDFINFVHMKPSINGYPETSSFQDCFITEFDEGMIRINNINQIQPMHYYEKDFVTSEMKDYYGSRIS